MLNISSVASLAVRMHSMERKNNEKEFGATPNSDNLVFLPNRGIKFLEIFLFY